MRIGGLASGMDIDSIVKDLMKAERMPLDKLKQNKQVLEWQRDDYRSINTLLLNFRSELTNMRLSSTYRVRTTTSTDDSKVTTTATSAAGKATYTISKVQQLATSAVKINTDSISGNNNNKIDPGKGLFEIRDTFKGGEAGFDWKTGSVESKTMNVDTTGTTAKVTLNGGAIINLDEPISIKVNGKSYKVVKNTDPATFTSSTLGSGEVAVDKDGNLIFKDAIAKGSTIKADFIADKKVDTLKYTEAKPGFQLSKGSIAGVVDITVGGKIYRTDSDDPSKINEIDAVGGIVNANVGKLDRTTGNVSLSIPKDTEVTVTYQQNYFTFGLETETSKGKMDETFFVQGTESLNTVMSKVNGSQAGVTMFYDSFSDKVTLTRSEQGQFGGDGVDQIVTKGNFLNMALKFQGAGAAVAQNAKFTINGLDTERNSNTFTMNGVTFTLKQTFNVTDPNDDTVIINPSTPISVSINNDSSKVFENIKGFIDKYNELIGTINKKLTEERYRSYTPLTDDQRESLSDKQQEQWEEKAKSGLLKRDPILSQTLSSMRMDFYGPVQNDEINPLFKQLASIGIKTTANYLEGGKLEINESELKKAIEADPDAVEKLFNATGNTFAQKGIAQRLTDSVNGIMDKLKEKAGNSFSTNQQFALGRQLNDMNSRIDRFEDRMKQVENRYWRQFTAMEKAIQQSNQQSTYLMQQFSGGM